MLSPRKINDDQEHEVYDGRLNATMPYKTISTKTSNVAKAKIARKFLTAGGVTREDSDDELGTEDHPWQWIYSNSQDNGSRDIVGARMGNFHCARGDCVLLKAESNEAWVGLITDFEVGENGNKSANFMWFSTPKEISRTRRNKQLLKSDALSVRKWLGIRYMILS